MAEKNTLSILESIKQKMIQFDQKDPKKTSVLSGDEFAYISPEKNNLNKATEENSTLSQENKALDEDFELNDNQKKSAVDFMGSEDHEENPFIPNPLTQDNDDFLFEGEDEVIESQKSFLQHEHTEIEENKLESNILKKENEVAKSESSAKKEEIVKEENSNKIQAPVIDEDDIDLDDLDLDEEIHKQEIKREIKKDDSQNHELGFDEDEDFLTLDEDEDEDENEDLEIEEDEDENLETEDEDLEIENDEEDLEIEEPAVNKKEEIKPEPKKQDVAKNLVEDDFFDRKSSEDKDFLSDIDLDSDDEILEEKNPEPVKQELQQTSVISNVSNVSSIPSKRDQAEQSLINEETLQQTTSSIRKLIDANNVVHGMKSFSNPNNSAFNELAVQLMEPKLEKWLNEHLSNLVEEIVREEIKKIIPKD